jgi:peptidyl-prolyl cis-trans isomerase A (cyclophilin A)
MARSAPGTATGDFFITVGPSSYFDADPTQSGDNLGYAAFGQVIDGMDVVKKILALPTDGFARNPAMKGQILTIPVPIIKMRMLAA